MQRVVVTGMGAVTPLGVGVQGVWQGLIAGRSGVGRITRFDPHQHRTQIAAQVSDFDPLAFMEKKDVLRTDLFIQYALAATGEAMHDASLVLSGGIADRTGTSIGTAMGGAPKLTEAQSILSQYGASRAVPYMIPAIIPNMAAGWISMRYGAKGPNTSPSTACAAGRHRQWHGSRQIQRGDADIMLTGGSEAIVTPLVLWGFDSMRALSSRNEAPQYASRPFDAQRDGFVLGEGSGVVILEEREYALARGARIYAELCGYAMTADAYHPTTPAPDADGAARCMALTLSDAGFQPSDIDYISAHGTSTPFNDARETKAIT